MQKSYLRIFLSLVLIFSLILPMQMVSAQGNDHWAKDSAIELFKRGIIDIPIPSNYFNEEVTRAEFIETFVKAQNLYLPKVKETKFEDVDQDLAPYVQAALNNYVTNGVSETKFGSNQILTREEAITLLIRGLHVPSDSNYSKFVQYTDNAQVSSWAKASVSKALDLELVQGTSTTTITPKKALTRGEIIALIHNYLNKKENFPIKKIDIFATNDFHGALEGGYEAGAAKLAAIYNEFKKENPEGSILLDAGDAYQGTPLSNVFFGEPVVEVYNKMGYNAMTVGNHEFDWGIESVLESMETANYPLVAANIYDKETNQPVDWAEPYTIVEKNGLKIGVIGLATPQTLEAAKLEFIENYDFKDPIEIANQLVPEVKEAGADLVLLLTHIPGSMENGEIKGELADLANGVTDVDGIIGGHSHKDVFGFVNNIPVVEANKNGRMLSHITIFYNEKTGEVVENYSKLIDVRKSTLDVEPDQEVQEIVDRYNEDVKPIFDEVVGTTTVDLKPDYNNESNIGNWMSDVIREKAGTQIAFQNAGGIRAELPAGDITVGDIFTIMPFDNTIVTAEMTGEQLKAVLEQSVTLYKGMMQTSGLVVKYDSTKPEYQRVVEIKLADGTLVEMDQKYTVATNDFLSGGQDGFKTLGEVEWTDTFDLIRDALIDNVVDLEEIAPKVENRMIDVSTVK